MKELWKSREHVWAEDFYPLARQRSEMKLKLQVRRRPLFASCLRGEGAFARVCRGSVGRCQQVWVHRRPEQGHRYSGYAKSLFLIRFSAADFFPEAFSVFMILNLHQLKRVGTRHRNSCLLNFLFPNRKRCLDGSRSSSQRLYGLTLHKYCGHLRSP